MIYLDMDGVLVNQVGRKRWDLMGWMPDGRELWEYLKPLRPTLLSQLMKDVWEVSRHEKRAWVDRELGKNIPLIVVRAEEGKHPYCRRGDMLIDDTESHCEPWRRCGGIFVLHKSAERSIAIVKSLFGEYDRPGG